MNNRIPYLASIVEHHLNLANEAALQTKPQTESEAEDVQRCPRCDGQDVSIAITGVCTCRNDSCRHFWDPSKRRERSGSGNAEIEPRR